MHSATCDRMNIPDPTRTLEFDMILCPECLYHFSVLSACIHKLCQCALDIGGFHNILINK